MQAEAVDTSNTSAQIQATSQDGCQIKDRKQIQATKHI